MSRQKRVLPVEFYVETFSLPGVKVTDVKSGEVLPAQLSSHPRGVEMLKDGLEAFLPRSMSRRKSVNGFAM